MAKELRIVLPDAVWRRLQKISKETGITVQDIMIRAVVRAIEDFENIGKRGRK